MSNKSNSVPGRNVSFTSAASIVAKREISVRLRSKAFVYSGLIVLLGILLVTLLGPRLGDIFSGDDTRIGVLSETEGVVKEIPETDVTIYDSRAKLEKAIENDDVEAGVVARQTSSETDEPSELEILALREAPESLMTSLSMSPSVTLLDKDAQNPALLYFVGFGFGLVYFMAVISFGNVIAQSVLEEKESRIVEILLATVSPQAILTGKIIGVSILAIGQIALFALAGFIGITVNGETLNIEGLAAPIGWFVVHFAMVFILFAALYAGLASMVSRTEDLASATMPLTFLVMAPYFLIIFFNTNVEALTIMSYIPFTSPVAVPMLIFTGDIGVGHALISTAILALAMAAAIWLASVIYHRSILRTGKKVKFSEVFSRAA